PRHLYRVAVVSDRWVVEVLSLGERLRNDQFTQSRRLALDVLSTLLVDQRILKVSGYCVERLPIRFCADTDGKYAGTGPRNEQITSVCEPITRAQQRFSRVYGLVDKQGHATAIDRCADHIAVPWTLWHCKAPCRQRRTAGAIVRRRGIRGIRASRGTRANRVARNAKSARRTGAPVSGCCA